MFNNLPISLGSFMTSVMKILCSLKKKSPCRSKNHIINLILKLNTLLDYVSISTWNGFDMSKDKDYNLLKYICYTVSPGDAEKKMLMRILKQFINQSKN